jgi:hypothetical protein
MRNGFMLRRTPSAVFAYLDSRIEICRIARTRG